MGRSTLIAFGAVLIIFGTVWFLQGIDVLGGSAMSGKTLWAVVGPVLALVVAGVTVVGVRRPR
jgi:hypothetical protein